MGLGHLRIMKHLLDLRRWQWLDKDSIDRMQEERLSMMLESAYRTRHYRTLMDGNGLSPSDVLGDLASLPVTAKEDLRGNPDSFIPSGLDSSKLVLAKTSGSTGIPTEIRFDRDEQSYRSALVLFTEMMAGRSPFKLCAHVTHENHVPGLFSRISGIFPKFTLSIFDDEAKNLRLLKQRKPSMLKSYPSLVAMLAKLNSESKDPLELDSVYTCAEVLSDEVRQLVEESFSCVMFNQYGTIEVRSVAVECPEEHSMHIIPNSCIVEILDEHGRPRSSGSGDISLTCLHNSSMPLIRYMVGDRARWGKPCPCGRQTPVIQSIEGRKDDMITLPSGRVRPSFTVHPLIAQAREMLCYQLVQERPDLFVFRYVPARGPLPRKMEDIIAARIRRGCMGEEVRVEFEEADRLGKGRTGKMRTVISKVKRG